MPLALIMLTFSGLFICSACFFSCAMRSFSAVFRSFAVCCSLRLQDYWCCDNVCEGPSM